MRRSHRFWSTYLLWSVRICSGFASLYLFSALVDVALGSFSLPDRAGDVIVIVYSILSSEIIACLVDRRYRPHFLQKGDERRSASAGWPILEPDAFAYRVRAERIIYESIAFFGIHLPLALVLNLLLAVQPIGQMLIGAMLGIGSAFLCFLGVILMVVAVEREGRSISMPAARVLGLILLLPPYLYVRVGLSTFFGIRLF